MIVLLQNILWIGCDKLWSLVPHALHRTKHKEAEGSTVHIQIVKVISSRIVVYMTQPVL